MTVSPVSFYIRAAFCVRTCGLLWITSFDHSVDTRRRDAVQLVWRGPACKTQWFAARERAPQ
jgi:hypothetical protein